MRSMATQRILVALLRGINVGGNKKVPMDELRALAEEAGYGSVQTYINSGNLVFTSTATPAHVEATLEQALAKRFGFEVSVVVRTAEQWAKYAAKSLFPDAQAQRPNLLHLAVGKRPIAKGAAEALTALGAAGERVKALPDALWIDYVGGAGRSKLSPAALDKHAGSPVTARNWNTVVKLAELAQGQVR
jgi:uncharacterized protein (DUF1697 family)